jgi:hypothetical protein
MANYHGVGVQFAMPSASIANVTGAFQTNDHIQESSKEMITSSGGEPITVTYFGFVETATFEWVAQNNSTATGTATVTLPTQGSQANVTDSIYTQIAGSNWLVDRNEIKRGNSVSVRVTTHLWRASGIST